ncbi:MAG TPA: acyl-CoA dehydrogenase family protein [Kofleriaceae bacterium]|nr:acyl-CoA dehydrogenase family protein [Kofleriaceae bacterium]
MILDEALAVARKLADEQLRPRKQQIDESGEWPRDSLRALQAAGLGGLVVPSDAGGQGHGLLAVARVCDVLAFECPSTAISYGMHLVGSAVVAAKATAAQRRQYLEPIARGEHLTTLALSEPGTGSHFYLPETTLARSSDGYVLHGTKTFVTSGGYADSYVMSAAPVGAAAPPGEFSCVVVPNHARGLQWASDWNGWGMRGNAARSVQLDHVRIDRDDLLGDEGDEIWFVFNVVAPFFLVAMAGTYLGIAAAALAAARDHLLERRHAHTGLRLADQPIVQHRFGTLWAELLRTRALVWDAARMGDDGDPDALPALCSAKAEVAITAEHITTEAMTLLGGRGYGNGHPLQRMYRDARAAHVMAPPTDLLRTWTGRAVLGLPILGE